MTFEDVKNALEDLFDGRAETCRFIGFQLAKA